MQTKREGEYREKGDYHKELDKNWRYYPIYRAKIEFIEGYLKSVSKNLRILDVGCGEGVLVEKYRRMGYNMMGMDLNYSSSHVLKGDITRAPFKSKEFDVLLCLDVVEHLNFEDQKKALDEANRLLKEGGYALLAIPNLAHLASRFSFLLTGKLLRTSTIERHRGDRPIGEYLSMVDKAGFEVIKRKGIFPTFPISSLLTYLFPARVWWLHTILNRWLAYPNWCFLNVLVCKKV